MIYQKGWLMRQIESMIAAILLFLSHSSKDKIQPASLLTEEIDCFLEQGDICGAENWIYENLDNQDIQWLNVFLAGIYRIEQGRPMFSILTKAPAESIAFIYNRMSVILPNEATDWLNPRFIGAEVLTAL